MFPSKVHIAPETRTNAHDFIKRSALSFGKVNTHSINTGIKEQAEIFSQKKQPFGLVMINTIQVYYVDDFNLTTDQKKNIKNANLQPTGFPGVSFLRENELTNIAIEKNSDEDDDSRYTPE